MTDNLPDYSAVKVPDGKPPEKYSHHERRADLLRRCVSAGSPFAVNQSTVSDEYGVSRATISRDMEHVRESVGDSIGEGAMLTARAVFERALLDMQRADDWRASRAAFKTVMDWNDWLGDIGVQHRAPDELRVDANVDPGEAYMQMLDEAEDVREELRESSELPAAVSTPTGAAESVEATDGGEIALDDTANADDELEPAPDPAEMEAELHVRAEERRAAADAAGPDSGDPGSRRRAARRRCGRTLAGGARRRAGCRRRRHARRDRRERGRRACWPASPNCGTGSGWRTNDSMTEISDDSSGSAFESVRRWLTGADGDDGAQSEIDDGGGFSAVRQWVDETAGRASPSSWFDQLRDWFESGALHDAVRERAGPVVIRVGRKARVPPEVARDPDIHITAKWTKTGQHGVDNADPHDQRNYDPNRFPDANAKSRAFIATREARRERNRRQDRATGGDDNTDNDRRSAATDRR